MKTPVAFIIFNRPDVTARVFEAIRRARLPLLLVIADGARTSKPGETEKCAATRAVIDGVDWDCEVRTNYSDVNLGCKRRVSSGLDWVFSEVAEAIILEDDCLPAPSFFSFCESLLEKYRHDERIMMISGDCFGDSQCTSNESYRFTKYGGIWGWASWRRAWQQCDIEMKTWPEYKKSGLINSFFDSDNERKFWSKIFDDAHSGKIDAWSYSWIYSRWSQSSLDIVPSVNLISNIGFRADGTHTIVYDKLMADLAVKDIWEIRYPTATIRNKALDSYLFKNIYNRRSSLTDIGKKVIRKVILQRL